MYARGGVWIVALTAFASSGCDMSRPEPSDTAAGEVVIDSTAPAPAPPAIVQPDPPPASIEEPAQDRVTAGGGAVSRDRALAATVGGASAPDRALTATLGGPSSPATAPAVRTPDVVTRTPAPTSDVPYATTSETAELAAVLAVPVAGVARSQLRDSYTERRGAAGGRVHEAIDIHAARGTPVVSAADGRLLRLFNSRAGGLMIYATDATERFILLYSHLDRYAAGMRDGMPLKRGQVIGYVGTTGNAPPNTPHLHFGILRGDPRSSWSEGTPVNPYVLLTAQRSR